MKTSTFNDSSNLEKMRSASSTPAITPGSFTRSLAFPLASAGMQASEVWSPSPISSDKDLMQLVKDNVKMIDPMKMVNIGKEEVLKVTPYTGLTDHEEYNLKLRQKSQPKLK